MMSGLILLGLRLLAAVALYGFLGWALFLFWHTLLLAKSLFGPGLPAATWSSDGKAIASVGSTTSPSLPGTPDSVSITSNCCGASLRKKRRQAKGVSSGKYQ